VVDQCGKGDLPTKSEEDIRLESVIGEKPYQNVLDGSVPIVEKYLKDKAKDPSSITFYNWDNLVPDEKTTKGWIVKADRSGKNSFGGTTRNVDFFVIKNGQVIKTVKAQ
jgi:hypothetical protein